MYALKNREGCFVTPALPGSPYAFSSLLSHARLFASVGKAEAWRTNMLARGWKVASCEPIAVSGISTAVRGCRH